VVLWPLAAAARGEIEQGSGVAVEQQDGAGRRCAVLASPRGHVLEREVVAALLLCGGKCSLSRESSWALAARAAMLQDFAVTKLVKRSKEPPCGAQAAATGAENALQRPGAAASLSARGTVRCVRMALLALKILQVHRGNVAVCTGNTQG